MDTEFKTDTTYTIIKGKFKATASSSFGLFIAFLDNVTKNVDKSDVISSHFSTIFENNINMPWNELEDLISKMKWKGEYATNLTHDIQSTMEDLFEPGTGRGIDIWHAIKKSQLTKTIGIFEEYLMRPTGDKNIKCEISVETINKTDIEDVKKMREMRDNQDLLASDISSVTQPAAPNIEDSAVVLEMSLVLSPISGVPLTELKQGEKILIKISEQTSRGQYFIDLFNASQGNEILPIPATIESVTPSGKFYTVMVSLGPGIYGKAMEEDNVKAKRYDPAQDKRKQIPTLPQQNPALSAAATTAAPDGLEEEKPKNKNLILFIIGGMAVLLLIILILLFV